MNNHIRCFKCVHDHYTKDCHLKGLVCFKWGKPSNVFSMNNRSHILVLLFQEKPYHNRESLHHY